MKKFICTLVCIILFSNAVFAESWGVYFPKDGGRPETNATAEHLLQFDAYFIGSEDDKVLYLTFDAGYEIDLTAGMLDVLKKHEVPAAFFLVGTYIRDYPQLVTRMIEEGHIVANHTMTHPDMSKIASKEEFAKELHGVEEIYKNLTGEDIPKFYRPPRGIYNEQNLKNAQELGYKTMFWSTAYKDWERDNQPSREEAFSKLIPRTHPGAIILLHNISKTNADILDELLTKCKDMGYRFESLYHLTSATTL
ncbi:MAG: polysaccharide deacetylase family protein [Defluviitaleaceae bacterium]|nr:polysaccharide deacetylase family protein [Defluviitaleaceae bacterium]